MYHTVFVQDEFVWGEIAAFCELEVISDENLQHSA